jgi:Tetratricopeptide repeat
MGTLKLLQMVADGSEALHLLCWMPYVNTCRTSLGHISLRGEPKAVGAANLASTYWNQGRLSEAEVLEEKVLEMRTQVLGEENPDMLTGMANLAHTLRSQGRNGGGVALRSRCVQ